MGAQAVRQRARLTRIGVRHRRLRWWFALALSALLATGAAAQDTTFDDGATLAERLLAGVVRVHADEHGFGLVIGADSDFVYIATARHVVGTAAQIVAHGCMKALPPDLAAERVAGFDTVADDLALLRVPRPTGYQVSPRALASLERVAVADPAWLLGRDDACVVLPRAGAVAMRPNERALWRVDMPGVLGGSSGAPVATGHGIIGITTDSDNANITAIDITQVAKRVRASGARFHLVDARNEPPTDPQAAEQDLAEMLNRYLLELRDAQTVLRQPTVKRDYFVQTVTEYNKAAERFIKSMNKYDGTLRRHWPPEVAQEWLVLRDRLWAVHQNNFLFVNEHARKIVETERVPDVVRDRMEALDPELTGLQGAIAQFLRSLGQRRIVDGNPKQ
ncbi:serine protease [Variovorax sp. J22R133]|uniref:S1 family peptidase n=1 Tax=Variovorax brevis TaxID=3053503 RepID=UPI002574A607|nr:serine protease [Variovorax sp. J22R133]MDM0118004.1 serine protease [Variovorax sp. J22R133]